MATIKPSSRRHPAIVSYKKRLLQATDEQEKLVGWLRKKGKTPEALSLADKLVICRPQQRCMSGACPTCITRAQQRLAKAIGQLARDTDGNAFVLTVVPESSIVEIGKLVETSHENHVRRLKRALAGVDAQWLVGATDYSLNRDQDEKFQRFWCPHLFVIGVAKDIGEIRAQVKAKYQRSDRVKRPVKCVAWDGSKNALLYTLKTDFTQRVSFRSERLVKATGETRACDDTSKQRLCSADRLELKLHLDRVGIQKRIFSQWCEVHMGPRSYGLRLTK